MTRTIWCAVFSLAVLCPGLSAQGQTSPPTNASSAANGLPTVWQPNSSVAVYLNPSVFPPNSTQYNAVVQGFNNDQAAYGPDDGVTYTFQSALPPGGSPTGNQVYVTESSTLGTDVAGNDNFTSTFNSVYGVNFTNGSTITIATSIVSNAGSTAALTEVASHEDSHNEGLGDCPPCTSGSTIMSYKNLTVTNGVTKTSITAPTKTDISVQKSITANGPCNGEDPCTCNPNNCSSYCGENPGSSGCQQYYGCPDACNSECSDYDLCTCNPSACQPDCDPCDPSCESYDPCACGGEDCSCNPDYC